MLELRKINIDEFDNVFAIMEQSFPDDERRNYTDSGHCLIILNIVYMLSMMTGIIE